MLIYYPKDNLSEMSCVCHVCGKNTSRQMCNDCKNILSHLGKSFTCSFPTSLLEASVDTLRHHFYQAHTTDVSFIWPEVLEHEEFMSRLEEAIGKNRPLCTPGMVAYVNLVRAARPQGLTVLRLTDVIDEDKDNDLQTLLFGEASVNN